MNHLSWMLFVYYFNNKTNPILILFDNNKLTNDNFNKWKSNLNLVLIIENVHFFLIEECPLTPTVNTTWTVREAFDCLLFTNNKAKFYLLVATDDVIMESLRLMFGKPLEQARYEVVMNAKMREGTSIHQHTLKMIIHINDAKVN